MVTSFKPAGVRFWLFVSAILFAVGEFVDAFSTNFPVSGIVLALMIAGCGLWLLLRKSRIPVILLLILATLELALVLFVYPHATPPPAPGRLAIFVVLTVAVDVLAIFTLARGDKSPVADRPRRNLFRHG